MGEEKTDRGIKGRRERRRGVLAAASDWMLLLFMAAMLLLCVAMPILFAYMAQDEKGPGPFLFLGSRYLGPGLFVLVHVAMIPLFFGKSGAGEGNTGNGGGTCDRMEERRIGSKRTSSPSKMTQSGHPLKDAGKEDRNGGKDTGHR